METQTVTNTSNCQVAYDEQITLDIAASGVSSEMVDGKGDTGS